MAAARGGRGRPAMRGRRKGPETTGDSDDSDDDGGGGKGLDAKKAAQQKMIEDMMAEQVGITSCARRFCLFVDGAEGGLTCAVVPEMVRARQAFHFCSVFVVVCLLQPRHCRGTKIEPGVV